MKKIDAEHWLSGALGNGGYAVLGVLFFAGMATVLYRMAVAKP